MVSAESLDSAKELKDVAKDAVIDAMDLEKEDFIAGTVEEEVS